MNFDLTHFDAACDWLHANNMTWQKWLPDKTECFERFGLYNERQDAWHICGLLQHRSNCLQPNNSYGLQKAYFCTYFGFSL